MRTFTIHRQKPFRTKETIVGKPEAQREIIDALQAVCDAYRGTDSLLLLQCQSALKKARTL
jgi:hypothetical protein